ncbi:MAG: hypothetical protein A3C61_01405 [Candidatus Yanofskybacteria bacterium RIFCSPHIGHO2_02_FULL_39_10]|uniref:Beta-glucosidase n=1 Tax=Candidatus Yanofskybacteria bacterium RIFCSPHIGHO2_02_FULL_39_10 TaxID=1802674 RepID=A0A1F8F9P3_9BACT|nr:MAG: hypothetical protein A3C61_01405 [Candidatus Yanofskybacteria bacterium RIFCSPHIGHO2_02_FULL_39_10]
MPIYKFPEKFWWGSATSAHQIEGDSHNDWTEWEKSPARIEQLKKEGKDPADFISGKACDSYNRFNEDFDIAKQLNQNIHRFSIEWSRIEPEEGRFDSQAMQHYINVVNALRDRGIEPMITLWHFTNPVWFAQKGGFLNVDSPKYYTRYVKYVVENLKDKVDLWITFNEATTVYSGFSYLNGTWPPQDRSPLKAIRVNRNIIRAHISAYREIRSIYHSPLGLSNSSWNDKTQGQVGQNDTSHNVEVGVAESIAYVPIGNKFYQKFLGKLYNYYRNFYFWTKASPYYDFIGLNYYTVDRHIPGSFESLVKQEVIPEMNWEMYPEGLYRLLSDFKKFNKPIFITENGIADGTDQKRLKFIKDHLYWTWRAIRDGIDVKGYLYWSLLDNFEWHRGFAPRFGLAEVNYKTFERHIRPSALEYAKICLANQLEVD